MGSQEESDTTAAKQQQSLRSLMLCPSPDDIIAAVAGKVQHHWSKMQVTDADKARCGEMPSSRGTAVMDASQRGNPKFSSYKTELKKKKIVVVS